MAMANPRPAIPSETDEQAAFVKWLNWKRIPHFSVPSEGERTKRFAARLKRTGWRAGVPDLIVLELAPVDLRPVAIEMKRRDGKMSDSQKLMQRVMLENRWHVRACYGHIEAIAFMEELGWR